MEHQQLYHWIGQHIADIRRQKKVSQTFLAKKVGLSQSSIANIEKGRQQAPLHILLIIAAILGVPATDIIPINNEHLPSDDDLISKIDGDANVNEENKSKAKHFIENL